MTSVTVEGTIMSQLGKHAQPVELRDPSGRVLGKFFPALDLTQYEPWEPPLDEAELQRREQSRANRYSTAEVLDYLEKL